MSLNVPVETTNQKDWNRKVANAINAPVPGPYANDAAAAVGNVAIGEIYKKTGGSIAWRVS